MVEKIDLETIYSEHKGLKGLFETFLRRFKVLTQLLLIVPLFMAASAIVGLSAAPGIWVYNFLTSNLQDDFLGLFMTGFALALGFFTFSFSLVIVIPMINFILRGYLKPWRGPYYSFEAFRWYLHNGLTYLPRFIVLNFLTPSPIVNIFFKLMGMKIGHGTVINTTYISDPSLITLGKKVTIGGSVTLVAHYGQGGLLVIAPVVIGDNCTLGLKSSVLGGVTIGHNVKILPHSVVMPKTVIPDGEIWGGIPAVRISEEKVKILSFKPA